MYELNCSIIITVNRVLTPCVLIILKLVGKLSGYLNNSNDVQHTPSADSVEC